MNLLEQIAPIDFPANLPSTLLAVEQTFDAPKVDDLAAELSDRFGPLPDEARRLLDFARLRCRAIDLGIDSITRQFDTRTLVLMPVAMALNIVLGTAVASALKIPIYLDSVGTILVAALAGPLAGAATGFSDPVSIAIQ